LIISGSTSASQTRALGALIVIDACATNVSAIDPRLSLAAAGRRWHDAQIDKTRVDVWLGAVRFYKTRSEATAACRGGHVRVNRGAAKASTQVKVGDSIDAFVGRPRILEVVAIIEKRVGAPVAAKCLIDHSPPAPVVKRQPRVAVREPGSGRPTKRERREIDRLRGL
jgi:ribosome-associated heat shock protein Hsp15